MSETELEMARRHVREGESRIARQEALVAGINASRSPALLATAGHILTTMRASQVIAIKHLKDLEDAPHAPR